MENLMHKRWLVLTLGQRYSAFEPTNGHWCINKSPQKLQQWSRARNTISGGVDPEIRACSLLIKTAD